MPTPERSGAVHLSVLLVAAALGCAPAAEPGATGFISSATPEATGAGLEILAAGGNAVDAAVAVSLALGVTEPAGSGLGGQTVMLVYRPGAGAVVVDGGSVAPAATPAGAAAADLAGHRLTTVPTTVKALDFALRELGSGRVSWAEALAPAIRYAENGYALTGFRYRLLSRYREALRASPSTASMYLDEAGTVPDSGAIHRQPVLARTLRRLAEVGASDFYTGEIAAAIDRDMRAHGGWLTAADLADAPEPHLVPAISTRYRGRTVYTVPPPYGGWIVLQALNVLDRAPAGLMAHRSPARTAWLAEALRFGHGTRLTAPVPDLDDWEQAVAERIDPETARTWLEQRPAMPAAGESAGATGGGALAIDPDLDGETTHFTVIDRHGMAVAVTQSINSSYGARAASAELGFPYNSYMIEFEPGTEDHPFALRPGGRPLSSMSPTVVAREGRVELALGSPGSSRIISSIVQVVANVVDGGMAIEAAVAEPRVHVIPAVDGRDILYLEGLDPVFDAATDETGITRTVGPVAAQIRARLAPDAAVDFWGGAALVEATGSRDLLINGRDSGSGILATSGLRLDPYFGGIHAIMVRNGVSGAADPRRDGVAASDAVVVLPQSSGTAAQLRGLSVASAAVWATGTNGAYTHTSDGGGSWHAGTIPGAESLFLVDVHAVSADTAMVLGTSFSGGLARVYRTDDGGATWRVVHEDDRPGAFYDGLACWDARRCVAFGDPTDGRLTAARTEDGETWTVVATDALPDPLEGEAGFAASGTAVAVAGSAHAWIGTGGGEHARVYRTDDGGATWSAATTPLPGGSSAGIFGIAFQDTLNGMAVGGDYTRPADPAPNLLRTTDGGRSWQWVGSTKPVGVKWGLAYGVVAEQPLWLATAPAGSGWSADGGATWHALADGDYNTAAVADGTGWLAGARGRIGRVVGPGP